MTVLSARDLTKSFGAGAARREVVDVPRLDLGAGERLALFGPSGSGKTTFLHLLAGILVADGGTVTVAGEPMTGRSETGRDRLRARRLGIVFQTFHLLQGYTALENVLLAMRFAGAFDERRARTLLDRVGLGDRLNDRPRSLSVGQQQRVAVVRALAHRPDVVLADEPTGNLDPENSERALALMTELCEEVGAALLIVSHEPEVLAAFDSRCDFRELNRAGVAS